LSEIQIPLPKPETPAAPAAAKAATEVTPTVPAPAPAATPPASPTPPVAAGPAGDRPDWLPEKFKTGADMAAAYTALETKLGKPEDAPKPEDPAAFFKPFADEFASKGELSPESLAKLTERIPKEMVDSYIAGQVAVGKTELQRVLDSVGGSEAYAKMIEWAAENLEGPEIDAFNKSTSTGDPLQTNLAVAGLFGRWKADLATAPKLVEGAVSPANDPPFANWDEVTTAMRDERYSKNEAYRNEIARKLARSNLKS
jgi:hypothetical protein